jgi:hypothetical protein
MAGISIDFPNTYFTVYKGKFDAYVLAKRVQN